MNGQGIRYALVVVVKNVRTSKRGSKEDDYQCAREVDIRQSGGRARST